MKFRNAVICLIAAGVAGCGPANVGDIDSVEGLENKPDLLSMKQGAVLLNNTGSWEGFSGLQLFDDCNWTAWNSAKGKPLNNTFDIELQSPCRITDVVVNNEKDRATIFPENQVKTFRVMASADSPVSGYEQLAEVKLNKWSLKRLTFKPKADSRPYRWLRFILVDNWGSEDATVLDEIQAYGDRVDDSAGITKPGFKSGVFNGDWSTMNFVTDGSTLFGRFCKRYEDNLDMLGSIRGNQARVFMPFVGTPAVALMTQSADGNVVNISNYYRSEGMPKDSNLFAIQMREKSPSCKEEPIKSTEELIAKYLERYHKAILYGIDFKPDSAELTSDSDATLNAIVALLKSQPKLRLSVEAHNGWTDSNSFANFELNFKDDSVKPHIKLSEARAQTVVDWLCNHKVERSRLKTKGWGKEKPVFRDSLITPSQSIIMNRRVELIPLESSGTAVKPSL